MAEPQFKKPSAGGAGRLVKRVPKWAWYVSGGVAIAAIIYYVRTGQTVDETAPGDLEDEEGVVGYTDAEQAPGIIVPPVIGGEAVSGELNTDIPSTTLDIFGGLISDLVGAQPDTADILSLLASAGSPVAGAVPSGVVTTAPISAPKPKPKPKPNPCTKLDRGYHCGSTVNMGPRAKKTFKGAKGWARTQSGGKGKNHWIDVHVRYCNRLERWRVEPNKGNKWRKIWAGGRPNIC